MNIAANKINSVISSAVLEEINRNNLAYNDLISIEKTNDGKISSVGADMIIVNKLKNCLDIAVSDILSQKNEYISQIPVGSLFTKGLFYGRGFDIKIKFRPIGRAQSKMTGEFKEAGINQTLYKISFDVSVDVSIVFPFKYIEIPLECETVIAETIIVGDVPDSFTHFDLNGDITPQEFQGYVEDYMA